MDFTIIAAIITGACTITAAIIAKYQIKTKKSKNNDNNKIIENKDEYIDIPTQEHPKFLNPDEYDIEEENYIVTLGGLLQQSRNPKDVTIKKINKDK